MNNSTTTTYAIICEYNKHAKVNNKYIVMDIAYDMVTAKTKMINSCHDESIIDDFEKYEFGTDDIEDAIIQNDYLLDLGEYTIRIDEIQHGNDDTIFTSAFKNKEFFMHTINE